MEAIDLLGYVIILAILLVKKPETTKLVTLSLSFSRCVFLQTQSFGVTDAVILLLP